MKVFGIIVKIVVALAAIAGAVYVAATYGDQIVAWCKKLVSRCKCCCEGDCCCDDDCCCGDDDCCCGDDCCCEAAEEVVESEAAPVAAEADFES